MTNKVEINLVDRADTWRVFQAIYSGRHEQPSLRTGVAQASRRVVRMRAKTKRWRAFCEQQKDCTRAY